MTTDSRLFPCFLCLVAIAQFLVPAVIAWGSQKPRLSSRSTFHQTTAFQDKIKQKQRHAFHLPGSFQSLKSSLASSTTSSSSPSDLTPIAFGTPPENEHFFPFFGNEDGDISAEDTPSTYSIPLVQLALAGSLTTFVADVCMHPMDSIKTVQQSSSLGVGLSFVQAVEYLWNQGGGSFAAFYSGFLTYAISDAIAGAMKFTVWEIWQQHIMAKFLNIFNESNDQSANSVKQKVANASLLWMGAALAFVVSSVVLVPGELVKQQLQMGQYNGLLEAAAGIMNEKGPSGFYVGYEGLLFRDIPYTMMELGLYEMFKKAIDQQKQDTAARTTSSSPSNDLFWWEEMGAAAATGAIAAFATTPLDTIKTKLMVDQAVYHDASFSDCFMDTVHQFGVWNGLFAGVEARMGWLVAYTIIYLPAYDTLKRILQQRHLQHIEKQQQVPQRQFNALYDDFDLITETLKMGASVNATLTA